MPLGLDYHTMSLRGRPDWGPGASPRAQEELLLTVRRMGRPLAEREVQRKMAKLWLALRSLEETAGYADGVLGSKWGFSDQGVSTALSTQPWSLASTRNASSQQTQ